MSRFQIFVSSVVVALIIGILLGWMCRGTNDGVTISSSKDNKFEAGLLIGTYGAGTERLDPSQVVGPLGKKKVESLLRSVGGGQIIFWRLKGDEDVHASVRQADDSLRGNVLVFNTQPQN